MPKSNGRLGRFREGLVIVMNAELPTWLAARLAERLPGPMVGSRFEPHPRPWRHDDVAPANARPAAVFVLLYPHEGRWRLPLMLRTGGVDVHAGQVSLPGGAIEPGETSAEAAVREFHEELGDDGQRMAILGPLSPLYVRASNYLVAPWVGAVERRPAFVPNREEVAEIVETPLGDLMDPRRFGSHEREHEGHRFTAPHFVVGVHRVWGATCMILGEFATILSESGFSVEDY
jgi:8-oxo-dGTP pyrophosphatase MutT (NUDIX family)